MVKTIVLVGKVLVAFAILRVCLCSIPVFRLIIYFRATFELHEQQKKVCQLSVLLCKTKDFMPAKTRILTNQMHVLFLGLHKNV